MKRRGHEASCNTINQGGKDMYKLFVVWETGEKEVHTYATRQEAEEIAKGYKIAFGSQVWVSVS